MKYYTYIFFFILFSYSSAQSNMYVTAELGVGLFKANFHGNTAYSTPLINEESEHYNLNGALSFLMEWNSLSVEAGIGEGLRIWELKGNASNGNPFILKHKQSYPTVFVGGYYRYFITDRLSDLNVYAGGRLSADFVDYNAVESKKGANNDYMYATTNASDKINFNAVPEIGLKGFFESGNYWQLGVRYTLPLNGDFLNGEIKHFTQNNNYSNKVGYYTVEGQTIGVVLKYGFALNK